MTVRALDHLVLTVASIDDAVHFYSSMLGMRHETFGEGRHSLHFGTQKINLHVAGREFEPKATSPVPGSADLCFLVDDVAAKQSVLQDANVTIIEGPVKRTGATGKLLSIYVRDPDGNLVELSEVRT